MGLLFLQWFFQLISIFLLSSSLEYAITRMTKGEHSQIKLKFRATLGLEKFNIPKSAPVEYLITLNDFEKVRFD